MGGQEPPRETVGAKLECSHDQKNEKKSIISDKMNKMNPNFRVLVIT